MTRFSAPAIALARVFGLICLAYVRRGWQRGRNRNSGATMATQLIVLGVSGALYLGDEMWRETTSLAL